jgi:hypothetical protein
LNGTQAYQAAYPKASYAAARAHGARLVAKGSIKAELERMTAKAEEKAGSAVLTMAEALQFVTRIVRCKPQLEPADSDLWQSIKISEFGTERRLPDKLAALARWCDLKGEGSEAEKNDELAELLRELRK